MRGPDDDESRPQRDARDESARPIAYDPAIPRGAHRLHDDPARAPPGAMAIAVLGCLSVMCGIFGVFAWIKGNLYMNACRERGVKPEQLAVAGRLLGALGVVLNLLTTLSFAAEFFLNR